MTETQPETYEKGKLYQINIDELENDPDQPRKHFDEDSLANLGDSLSKNGVLQPILFRKDESGKLIIVAGERRVSAAKKRNIDKIPGIFFDGNHEEVALVENMMRENLTPVEEAMAFQKLKENNNYNDDEIASIFGKGRTTITEILSLNSLPDDIKNVCVKRPDISRRELLKIKRIRDAERQKDRFDALVAKYDAMRSGETITPQNRDKVEVASRQVQRLTEKLKNIREEWDDNDRDNLKDDIINLKQELELHTANDTDNDV